MANTGGEVGEQRSWGRQALPGQEGDGGQEAEGRAASACVTQDRGPCLSRGVSRLAVRPVGHGTALSGPGRLRLVPQPLSASSALPGSDA